MAVHWQTMKLVFVKKFFVNSQNVWPLKKGALSRA